MSRLRPKVAAASVTLALASASLLALAQPAAATDYLDCESYNSKIGYCDLFVDNGANSERWTVNGNAISAYDNKAYMVNVGCGGTWSNISVSYLNDYGASMTATETISCQSGPPQ